MTAGRAMAAATAPPCPQDPIIRSEEMTMLSTLPGVEAHERYLDVVALEGRHHCGADDAWNIASLILGLMTQDAWPEAE